jgi:hypothetical protein
MSNSGSRYVRSTETSYNKKSRSLAKATSLGPEELTISTLDNMELREITGTSRSNLNSRIQL